MSIALKERWRKKLPKRINSVALAENEEVVIACDDGCAYLLWRDGDHVNKICGKGSMVSASYNNGLFAVGCKDGNVYLIDIRGDLKNKVKVVRFVEAVMPLDENSLVGCSDACVKFDLSGRRLWSYDIGHVGKDLALNEGKLLVPDLSWWKVHSVDVESGSGQIMISLKEKVYSVDARGDKVVVGTSRGVALFSNGELLWKKNLGGMMNLVKFVDKYLAVVSLGNKKLMLFEQSGELKAELSLSGKPSAVDSYGPLVVVGTQEGEVIMLEVLGLEETEEEREEEKEEEREEVAERTEEEVAEAERREETEELAELKEIAEGTYMGTPVAKEILEEIGDITESIEGAKDVSDLIKKVLKKVDELVNVTSSDWRKVYTNYEEAEKLLEEVLHVVQQLREKIGEVEGCPEPEKLLEILRSRNPREFTMKLAELAPEGGNVAERVKAGIKLLKKCLEKYYLLPSSEEVEEVKKRLEEVKQEKEALKALIESGL